MSSSDIQDAFYMSLTAVFDELAKQREAKLRGKPLHTGPRLLKPKDAAEYLGIGLTKFTEMRNDPTIPEISAINVEGAPRFRREDLDKYINGRGKYKNG